MYALSFYPNCFGQIKKRLFIFRRQLLNYVQKFSFNRSKKALVLYKDQAFYNSKTYLFVFCGTLDRSSLKEIIYYSFLFSFTVHFSNGGLGLGRLVPTHWPFLIGLHYL